jgi:uncharacterized membrane protein YraQ (UPF0718 family)
MILSDKKIGRFLLVIEWLGVSLVGVFLAAYLGGLLVGFVEGQPLTMVLHSEPAFRVPLFVLGGALLFLLVAAFVPLVLSRNLEPS